MKKVLLSISLVALVGTGVLLFTAFKAEASDEGCTYGRCGYLKSDYTQCGNCAQQYSYYCWSHNR